MSPTTRARPCSRRSAPPLSRGEVHGIDPAPGHPAILRIVAPNRGPMTLSGTNTYVVGAAPCWVIDPGPDDPRHLAAVRDAGESRGGMEAVFLTHSHADHSAGVEALGAPLAWGVVGSGDESRVLDSDDTSFRRDLDPAHPAGESRVSADPPVDLGPFIAIATPGHAPDHTCFLWESVLFCGDLLLGEGSTIVPPAALGGSLADYMDSLERVAALEAELLAPGHGPWITDPGAKVAEYLEHRRERERKLVAALEAGERSRERLLDAAWGDVPTVLRPAAAMAMQAHLEKLEDEGVLEPDTTAP